MLYQPEHPFTELTQLYIHDGRGEMVPLDVRTLDIPGSGFVGFHVGDLVQKLEEQGCTTGQHVFLPNNPSVQHSRLNDLAVPNPDSVQRKYSLADNRIQVDLDAYEIKIDDAPTHFAPVGFQILACLAASRDRVLTYAQFANLVWKSPTVDESLIINLHSRMREVRKALGKDLGNPVTGAIRGKRSYGYLALSTLAS